MAKNPSILLTARATQSDRIYAYKVGCDDYIIKPFDPEELKTRINNLLINNKNRKEAIHENKVSPSNPTFQSGPTVDDLWFNEVEKYTLAGIESNNFSVATLAMEMNLSERQLARKLKTTTGMSPGNFIKEYRLLKARHILESNQVKTVAEVCYAVGFSTPDYFTKIYFSRFGKLPSSYSK